MPWSFGAVFTVAFFVVCNAAHAYYLMRVPLQRVDCNAVIAAILITGTIQVAMHFTGLGAAPTGKFATGALAIPIGLPVGVAWWTMEQPAFLIPVVSLVAYLRAGNHFHPGCAYLCMFALHYLQRAYIYPWLSRGKPYPLHAWCLAMLFCASNATAQANELLFSDNMRQASLASLYEPRTLLGFALFLVGMGANIHSDYILRSLRKPGERGYKIPRGGFFEFVSGAHFVGEIIEWTGFAMATGFATAPSAFAAFNWMGIGTRAIATHEWSIEYFGDKYPPGRKRLIPLIW